MTHLEMAEFLVNNSPFDLTDEDAYKVLLGVETELRLWREDSQIWSEAYEVIKRQKTIWSREIDFRPILEPWLEGEWGV